VYQIEMLFLNKQPCPFKECGRMKITYQVKRSLLIIAALGFALLATGQVKNPKRGIAYGHHGEADFQAISGSLSWWYNWGTTPESSVAGVFENYDMDFVPMAWNHLYSESKLRDFYSTHPEAKFLLGFNEPNFKEQANMTPSAAAAAWPGLEAIADEFGLELVGPAVNWCGNCVSEGGVTFTNPYEYLDAFFEACVDCRVDYIAVHNYMCYSSPVIDYLEEFKKYGKKIWLTEFACWDQATITLDMQKNLVIGTLDYLDNDTMIYRYSWFTGRSSGTPHIDLFESEPGKLTELGALYVNYNPVHDTGLYFQVPGRIEAENYTTMSGISLEATSDFDGTVNVGYIDSGDWLEYNIEVSDSAEYFLYLRIAATASSSIEVMVGDTLSTVVPVVSTGGWQNWTTLQGRILLDKGKTRLRLHTPKGQFNINWLRISTRENHSPSCSAGENMYINTPETTAFLMGEGSDPDGDSLVYRWTQTAGADCTIESPELNTTRVTGLKPGTYIFKLTVWDGFETLSDNVRVTVVNSSVGVDEGTAEILEVYPNPAEGMLKVGLPEGTGAYSLEILNSLGQVVLTGNGSSGEREMELDISHLGNGMYIVKLVAGEWTQVARIIKSDVQ
jgi:hypothetical protein